jgi:hypothetical protein
MAATANSTKQTDDRVRSRKLRAGAPPEGNSSSSPISPRMPSARRKAQGARQGSRLCLAGGASGGAPRRCCIRHRARHQRQAGGGSSRGSPAVQRALDRRTRGLDASGVRQILAPQRSCAGHRLHAQALAGLYPVPARRPGLPQQQCRRARAQKNCPWQKSMAFCRIRPRWTAGGDDVKPDRHSKNERRRPTGVAGRRARALADHPVRKLDELLLWSWQPGQQSTAA